MTARDTWLRQVIWLAGVGASVVVFGFVLWSVWEDAGRVVSGPAGTIFGDGWYSLRPGELSALEDLGLSEAWYGAFVLTRQLFFIAASLIVAAIIWRRSQTWVALYVTLFLVVGNIVVTGVDNELALAAVGTVRSALFVLGLVALLGLLYVFPDGRHARSFLVMLGIAVAALGTGLASAGGDFFWNYALFGIVPIALGGVVVQVRRVRRERGLVVPVAVLLAVYVATIAVLALAEDLLPGRTDPGFADLLGRLTVEGVVLALPLTVGLVIVWLITRHGVWDLELAVNRTAVYVALTALLVVTYVAVVIAIQAIVRRLTGITSGNLLGVVTATGLVALLFLPAQRRIQAVIDRVFFRRRYDLSRTLASFSERLRTREHLDAVAGDLLAVADETFQPRAMTLVLRRPAGGGT